MVIGWVEQRPNPHRYNHAVDEGDTGGDTHGEP